MRPRPISPHLSVYKFDYTMVMSISHRITGVILSVGLIVLGWWLMAVATGPSAYASAQRVLGAGVAQLLLAGWILAFVYHLVNGIRHLTWDVGMGLEKREARRSGWVAAAAFVIISAALLFLAFFARGGT